MTEAYPLYWPEGRPRTPEHRRQRSRFKTGFGAAVRLVVGELVRLGAKNAVVSSNVALRRDGLPLAAAKRVDDVGVAVYFLYKGKQTCFACDRWDRVEDNIYAIAKTIDAMRGISRWGTGDMLDAAFNGFTALPPPSSPTENWRMVLGNATSVEELDKNYRAQARLAHPDAGGSNEEMAKLNQARDAARRELAA